jgi:hypothetical protein
MFKLVAIIALLAFLEIALSLQSTCSTMRNTGQLTIRLKASHHHQKSVADFASLFYSDGVIVETEVKLGADAKHLHKIVFEPLQTESTADLRVHKKGSDGYTVSEKDTIIVNTEVQTGASIGMTVEDITEVGASGRVALPSQVKVPVKFEEKRTMTWSPGVVTRFISWGPGLTIRPKWRL